MLKKTTELLEQAQKRNVELQKRVEELEKDMGKYKLQDRRMSQAVEIKIAEGIHLTPDQQEEVRAYAVYLNTVLAGDKQLSHILPINPATPDLLVKMRDSWILAKFVNHAVPHTIDTRALNESKSNVPLSDGEAEENMTLLVESTRSIGLRVCIFSCDVLRCGKLRFFISHRLLCRVVRFSLLISSPSFPLPCCTK